MLQGFQFSPCFFLRTKLPEARVSRPRSEVSNSFLASPWDRWNKKAAWHDKKLATNRSFLRGLGRHILQDNAHMSFVSKKNRS